MSDGKSPYLSVIGLSHNTAPVEIREKMFIQAQRIQEALERLKKNSVGEVVILSTCNRTEIYCHPSQATDSAALIKSILSDYLQTPPEWFEDYTYILHNEQALRHLFLVASGLDSLVIGEPEIFGQVKEAYKIATSVPTTGRLTNKIFHKAFNAAKRIRTETKIGYNPLSISSMAIELAKKIFVNINEKKILVIGAGEMCKTALKYFLKEGIKEVHITNRTYQKAHELTLETTGTAHPLESLPDLLLSVDMVLSSTGSEKPIIEKHFAESVMKKRKHRPLFFIDIAVPRDIAPDVNDIENIYLYDIDDLKELSQRRLLDRVRESEKALAIIDEEVAGFAAELKERRLSPLIAHVIDEAEKIRAAEVSRVVQKTGSHDVDFINAINTATKIITNKLIHPHIAIIKSNKDPEAIKTLKEYFHFEEKDEK